MREELATNIKQSKKLIELGLDTKTANMYYKHDWDLDGYSVRDTYKLTVGNSDNSKDIPAWSLTALLSLLPTYRIDKNELELVKITVNDYSTNACNNLIEAAFESVCWLLEN